MTRIDNIKTILNVLKPHFLEIIDESESHKKHYLGDRTMETHLKLIISAKKLDNMSRIEQHRLINSLLEKEFATGLHALSIKIIKGNI